MSIRALVVDDEPIARRRVRRLLEDHEDVEIVAEAASGDEAVAAVLEHRPDLMFLDVKMPGRDGLQALRDIRCKLPEEIRPLIVFTTAYEEHAVEAFELQGIDYLVKPVERDQMGRALRRARKALWQRRGHEPAAPSAETPSAPAGEAGATTDVPAAGTAPAAAGQETVGYIAAHRAGKILQLDLHDVACLMLEDGIAWAYTPGGRYRLRQGLGEIEKRLACPPFFRVSRSAIINLRWVDHLAPMFSGTFNAYLRAPVQMEVHVSRRRARQLRQLLGW
jgi:two-component system LytT family response regulator